MAGYKALFVGEQKVKATNWKSRDDAAKQIVERGLSVVSVYETTQGRHYFDVSDKIAAKIFRDFGAGVPANVQAFVRLKRV